jgi:hypothetical protein
MNRDNLYSLRVAGWAGAALILAAAFLYLLTLDNGLRFGELEGGDLITHQYAQVQARPSNAPGYPLYTMGGWLWFHFWRGVAVRLGDALPNPIPILSSYSTLFAVLAVGLLYVVLLEVLSLSGQPRLSRYKRDLLSEQEPRSSRYKRDLLSEQESMRRVNWPLAWLMTAFYAVTYFFWYYAVTTEQYSSAVAQTLAIVYLYFLWRRRLADQPHPQFTIHNSQFTIPDLLLILLAFLCGLSLAHMLTVAFIIPPLVIAIVWEQPALLRRGRLLLAVTAAALLPLLSYAYVYVRGAAHPEWWGQGNWPDAWSWFWSFVSTSQGREELAWGFEAGRAFWGNGFPELIWQELSIPLLALGLTGIAFLGRRPAFVLYGALLLYALFCWMYRYGNWFQVILPAYPLILIGAAAGLHRFQWSRFAGRSRLLRLAPLVVMAIAVLWRFSASWPQANSRNLPTDRALDHPALLLDSLRQGDSQRFPPEAALFAASSDLHGLGYLIEIWGVLPGARIVGGDQAGWQLAEGGAVFSTWEMAPTLLEELPPQMKPILQTHNADWVSLSTAKADLPTPQMTTDERIGDELALVGYSIEPGPTGAPVTTTGPSLEVTLFWRLEVGEWPAGLSISVRPTQNGAYLPAPDGEPGTIVQQDVAEPMHGLWRAALPAAGDVIADAYRLTLPDGVEANGATALLYRREDEAFTTVAELHLPVGDR